MATKMIMFWKCVIILAVVLTTSICANIKYVNNKGSECHSNRLYLNLFIVKIGRNSQLSEIRNLLEEKGFRYLRAIVTTYHSFRLRGRNVTEGNCSFGVNWIKEFRGSKSILSIKQDYKILYNLEIQKMSAGDRWVSTSNSVRNGAIGDSKKFRSNDHLPANFTNVSGRVKVIVSDNGFDLEHPNLVNIINRSLSWDFLRNDSKPNIDSNWIGMNGASHGTMVMGIIAAEKIMGRLCNQGLCQHCELVGVQITDALFGPTDTDQALALGYLKHTTPVYSASYGVPDNMGFHDIREASNEALRDGVKNGRQCKGRIYVVPIGNGHHDNCNMDGYAKSVFTITVAEVDERLQLPKYTERCPCVLAAAIVDSNFYRTAVSGTCRKGRPGSSFAVPAMSACIAEMLYINPDLSERDVKHIIVNSTITTGLDQNVSWTMNAAKRHYSDRVGFGVSNCTKMQSLASRWSFVPEEIYCEQLTEGNRFKIDPQCRINYLEHVQVEIKMCCHDCKSSDWGQFQIDVQSPGGTVSSVMTSSTINESTKDIERHRCKTWTFTSVQFWGESPHGEWQVTWKTPNSLRTNLSTRRIFLYGTEDDPLTTEGTPKRCGKKDHKTIIKRGPLKYWITVPVVALSIFVVTIVIAGLCKINVIKFGPCLPRFFQDRERLQQTHSSTSINTQSTWF